MRLGYDQISEILKIIDSSACEEFVLETEEFKLVLRRRGGNGSRSSLVAEAPLPTSATIASSPGSAPPLRPQPANREPEGAPTVVVRAPMVGTFYRSPSPGAPPFVEVGSRVKRGDPLCIVEVMKLFTTITAECEGTITEIGAENATLVEYGQMLFVMKAE